MSVLGICLVIISIQLLVAVVLVIAKKKVSKLELVATPQNCSIIIPFRNEIDRLPALIATLNKIELVKELEIIFVDDYSNDASRVLIESTLKIPFTCIANRDNKGKKQAIRTGVNAAKHDFIFTWDADIQFDKTYLETLPFLVQKELVILPVGMTSENVIQRLSRVEFNFLRTLGQGLAGLGTPVICYGANLGFKKATFLELDEVRTDYSTTSGDDMFLLKAMAENNKEIVYYNNRTVQILTPSPNYLVHLLRQRRRWFGKAFQLVKSSTLVALLLLFAVQIVFIVSLINLPNSPLFILPIGLKLLAEILVTWEFCKLNSKNMLTVVLHQFWYPIYMLLLIVPVGKETRWMR